MVLKALELQGFKSFPDKTVLSFDKGMTAVVGPNGSGKSNISDAVRWVLGEQSTKNLRGAKMEDVIFGGTDQRRALGYAEVTLRLDNRDRSLNYDKDEVAITRRYYRSGEGEYKINGETVRLRDINELFMDTGLGRDGYSMVSQGKVADMVSSKSTGRRDMLEEASGISHFRYRRAESIKRLNQAEENLVRLRDILSELETRVEPLRVQSEKAQEFLVLAENRKQLEISLWLYNIDSLKEKIKEQERKVSIAQAQYDSAEAALEKIENDIEAASNRRTEINIAIEDIRKSISSFDEESSELSSQIAVKENTIEHNNQSIERLSRDMTDGDNDYNEFDKQIADIEAEIAGIQKTIDEKKAEFDRINAEVEQFAADMKSNNDKNADFTEKITDATANLADARLKQSTTEAAISDLHERLLGMDDQIGEKRANASDLKKLADEAKKRLEAAEDEKQSLENSISGYEIRLNNRTKKLEEKREAFDTIRREHEQLEGRIQMLSDLEKNMEGFAGSVKAVTKEAKRGTLRGIHGPLSQLISVPDKYSTAIETALGGAVQFIVVDSENDAKAAINYLKNNKVGRATFLPISAIRSKTLSEPGLDDCFGFVDIASNLVKADKKYTQIVEAQLARTVVVEDMDSAVAIGKKYKNRFKIVTLDGQVINAGGSMTGGARIKNAGLISRGGEINALKEKLEKLHEKLVAASEEGKKALADEATARAEFEAATADLTRANEELVRAESAYTLAQGNYEVADAAVKEVLMDQQGGADKKAELEKDLAAAKADVDRFAKALSDLENQSDSISDTVSSIQARYDESVQKRIDLDIEILGLNKDVEAKNTQKAGVEEQRDKAREKNLQLENEIEEFRKANEETEKEIAELKSNLDELKAKVKSADDKINELVEERNGVDKESGDLLLLERNKTSEREKSSGELARLEERKANMLRDYDDTVNKLYDEYQLTRREASEISKPAEDPTACSRELGEIKSKIKALGSVNVGAIEEYKEVSERYEFMNGQVSDIEKSKSELLTLIGELTGNMAKQFTTMFARINTEFGRTFTDLFGGGKAELRLENEDDILESPIEIRVQPPGKNVQNIDLLSGGEKGLSAIALLMAILKVTPAPFCIFDEVEAALDDVNVARFAHYVRRMTDNTQFILITHRRGTMEEADIMYGVTMEEEGVSKLLELKTAEMVQKLGLD